MERFLNAMKGHSAGQDAAAGQCRFGTVASVVAGAATARVVLQPEGVLTGWLPVLSPWSETVQTPDEPLSKVKVTGFPDPPPVADTS